MAAKKYDDEDEHGVVPMAGVAYFDADYGIPLPPDNEARKKMGFEPIEEMSSCKKTVKKSTQKGTK